MTVKNDKTLEKGFNEFITYCKSRSFRDDTIRHYTNIIKHIDKGIMLEDITQEIINKFIYNSKTGLYEYELHHNLNTKAITINIYDTEGYSSTGIK